MNTIQEGEEANTESATVFSQHIPSTLLCGMLGGFAQGIIFVPHSRYQL